jgi:hypothetical protein
MKLIALLFIVLATAAQAQWQTTNYSLKGGWNSIYLHGDASHAAPATLFASETEVLEVWRWNPNPNPLQFTAAPLVPAPGTSDWTVWKRDLSVVALSQMVGRRAYLIKCSGTATDTHTVSIPQKALPPASTWVRNGANLMGFPTRFGSNYPLFTNYFATFAAAIAANVKIYKYVGGDLGSGNPLQVFSPALERLDRNQAYWFDTEVVGNFYAPVQLSLSNLAGLDYGRTGSEIIVRVLNRSSATSTLTISPVNSNEAPSGQEAVYGAVPITRRVFNATTLVWDETPITTAYTEALAPNSSLELRFGINRGAMAAAANDAFFASMLRFTDSAGLYDILLPARARKGSLAGLWIGDALIKGVQSKAAGYTGTETSRAYPLRYILHVADDGTARVLSQVMLGKLATAPHDLGLCTKEAGLKSDTKASATRIVAAHLPLDRVLAASGAFTLGGSIAGTVNLAFNDPVNPFVHQYHPDHDNKSATGAALVAGQESYDISRAITFNIAANAPVGVSAAGYGASVVAGTYAETLTGLHKDSLSVSGTFLLRRVSEIGSITINP